MKIFLLLLLLNHIIYIKCSLDCGKLQNLKDISKWNVGIYIKEAKHFNLICMGTIIEPNVIITAAHCFCDSFSSQLRTESFYIKNSDKLPKNIAFGSEENNELIMIHKENIKIHENYQGLLAGLANNIALVKLSENLHDIKPICWNIENNYITDNAIGKMVTSDKNTLKLINANTLDFDLCYAIASKEFRIYLKGKLCAESSEFKDIVQNGGAGLIFQNPEDGLWYISGTLCSHESKPKEASSTNEIGRVAFINLKLYMNWISNNLVQWA